MRGWQTYKTLSAERHKKRIVWAVIGLVFAVFYGFWTALITGGGHGNFIWFILFVLVGGFGLYFPLMSFLAADLRSVWSKVVFGSLICFNLLASIFLIRSWVNEIPGDKPSDFDRAVRANGIEGVLVFAAAHFLPTLIFLSLLVRAIIRADKSPDDNATLSLDLS